MWRRRLALAALLTLLQLAEGLLPHASPRLLRAPCAVKHVVAAQPVDNVGGGGDGGDGGDGIQQWLQTNVLQGLAPAEQAALMGVTTLPWVIKPVYGFLTDGLP